jgi:hypothetical protein
MIGIKTIIGAVLLIWYLYSSFKNSDTSNKKKGMQNPTPASKGRLEDLMDRMIEEQKKKLKELNKPEPPPVQKPLSRKITPLKKTLAKQNLPFERRKRNEPAEMPSMKQIAKVQAREKKAVEPTKITVKDYDENIINHDKPHKEHHLSDNSKIKFDFSNHDDEAIEIDIRKAVIYQAIFERKEY